MADCVISGDSEGKKADDGKEVSIVSVPKTSRYRELSSLSSVLSEYGLGSRKEEKKKNGKKKIQRSQGVARENTFDREEREYKTKAKQERYMEVYDEVHRLRDYYYEDYLGQLQNKVQQQRAQIRQKSQEMNDKIARETLKKKKKKPTRVELSTDDSFLENLPKSDYYQIVSMEKKMAAEGKFKTQVERDAFWEQIRTPEVFNKHFPKPKQHGMMGSLSYASQTRSLASSFTSSHPTSDLTHEAADQVHMPLESQRRLTQIEEGRESARPDTRDGPTPLGSLQNRGLTQRKLVDPYTLAKSAAADLDRQFPQLPLPKLSCFSDLAMEHETEPLGTLAELASQRREKERHLFVKRLRRMYHLSQSNSASTQRIIDQHGDEFWVAKEGPSLDQLMAIPELMHPGKQDVQEVDEQDFRPWMRYLRGHRRSIMPIEELSEDEESGKQSPTSVSSAPPSIQRPKVVVIPLNLDDITEDTATVEAKKLSTLWSNYNRVLMPIPSKHGLQKV